MRGGNSPRHYPARRSQPATFYRHYPDKFELLERYAQQVYELLDAAAPGRGAGAAEAPGLVRMFDHIRANAAFYQVMLGQNGDPVFVGKVRQYIEKRMRRALPAALLANPISAGLYLSCISSSALGALLWWLEHDLPYMPEEMAAFAVQLSAANVTAMLEHASQMAGRGQARPG